MIYILILCEYKLSIMEELYKYNHKDYPNFSFDLEKLSSKISLADRAYGYIKGRFKDASLEVKNEITLSSMTSEVVSTALIENHHLDAEDVRDSIRKNLGLDKTKKNYISDTNVEVLLDSVLNNDEKLTHKTLFNWHKLFFPNGNPEDPDMPLGEYTKERMSIKSSSGKIIYLAPDPERIQSDMNMFLMWFNADSSHPFIKSGIAHLWFEIIHPFGDGNGRIGRAIIDRILAKEFDSSLRCIGISSYLSKNKKAYYSQLEYHSKGSMDITEFISWFIDIIIGAINTIDSKFDSLIKKDKFWAKYASVKFNQRQLKVLHKMLNPDFDGLMSVNKWSRICKISFDTANRDISMLLELEIFIENSEQKRNRKFKITEF